MMPAVWLGVVLVLSLVLPVVAQAEVPERALRYRADLIRNARAVWGMDAPVAVFAAQIHQESLWRPNAKSRFAAGLAQFTPDTARWIAGAYPAELGSDQPYNTAWALRALVRYDRHLHARLAGVDECSHMALVLASYNGGLGWVQRDQKLTTQRGGNRLIWFGQVEKHNAGRARWAYEENRGYPRAILLRWQPLYSAWGRGVDCAAYKGVS